METNDRLLAAAWQLARGAEPIRSPREVCQEVSARFGYDCEQDLWAELRRNGTYSIHVTRRHEFGHAQIEGDSCFWWAERDEVLWSRERPDWWS